MGLAMASWRGGPFPFSYPTQPFLMHPITPPQTPTYPSAFLAGLVALVGSVAFVRCFPLSSAMGDKAPLVLLARNPNHGNDAEEPGFEPVEEEVWIQGPPLSDSESATSPSPRPRPRRTTRWRTNSSESESECLGLFARVPPPASPQPEPERTPTPNPEPEPPTTRTRAPIAPRRAGPKPKQPTTRTRAPPSPRASAGAHGSQAKAGFEPEGGQAPHRPRGQGAGRGPLGQLRTHHIPPIPPPYGLKGTWLQRSFSAFTFCCHGSIGAVTGLAPGRIPGRLGKLGRHCGVGGDVWTPIAAPTPPSSPHPAQSSPSEGQAQGCSLLGGEDG